MHGGHIQPTDYKRLVGLFRQATHRIRQSPDSGGEASYVQWDTRPSWVLKIRHPIGAQGRQHCRVGNFPEARPAHGEVPETLCPTGLSLLVQIPYPLHMYWGNKYVVKLILLLTCVYLCKECL